MAVAILIAAPAGAATARQILTEAAFQIRDKKVALARIAEADRVASIALAQDAGNREAAMSRAMVLGYRAKLTHSRGDALAARKLFEAAVTADRRDAEAAAAVGTWHLDSVIELGAFVAGAAVGAKKKTGLDMMDRAVALGGNRAVYAGLAALLRLSLDPGDRRGRALAEAASFAQAPQPIDRIIQRGVIVILASLRAGDAKATQTLAKQLLPFGRLNR